MRQNKSVTLRAPLEIQKLQIYPQYQEVSGDFGRPKTQFLDKFQINF